MATENLLMAAVQAGGDRQDLHERIRLHSQAAAAGQAKGQANDLLERLAGDPAFSGVNITAMLEPLNFVGRAPEQVDEFLDVVVAPILKRYPPRRAAAEVRV